MSKNYIIKRANSPCINPLVVVTKQNCVISLCLDAKKLNSFLLVDYECASLVEYYSKSGMGTIYDKAGFDLRILTNIHT